MGWMTAPPARRPAYGRGPNSYRIREFHYCFPISDFVFHLSLYLR